MWVLRVQVYEMCVMYLPISCTGLWYHCWQKWPHSVRADYRSIHDQCYSRKAHVVKCPLLHVYLFCIFDSCDLVIAAWGWTVHLEQLKWDHSLQLSARQLKPLLSAIPMQVSASSIMCMRFSAAGTFVVAFNDKLHLSPWLCLSPPPKLCEYTNLMYYFWYWILK